MKIVIVSDALHDALNAKLDIAIALCPSAVAEREGLYRQLLEYYDEYGVIPDFTLAKTVEAEDADK